VNIQTEVADQLVSALRMAPEAGDLDAFARRVVNAALKDITVRHHLDTLNGKEYRHNLTRGGDASTSSLRRIAHEMRALSAAKAAPDAVWLYVAYVCAVAIDCTVNSLRLTPDVDVAEQKNDRREDELQDERIINRVETPATLEIEADARLQAIAAGLVSTVACYRRAREMEHDREVARERVREG
jgi:hypothetical protein